MLEVEVVNGQGLVWEPTTVSTLRIEHRIIGSLLGPGPRGGQERGLPLSLSNEELQLLREKGLVRTYKVAWPNVARKGLEKAKLFWEESYQEQVEEFKKERIVEIEKNAEKILAGKKKALKRKRKADDEKSEKVGESKEEVELDLASIIS